MISMHICPKASDHNTRKLGQYVWDASHKGEKCLMAWTQGFCDEQISLTAAIRTMQGTQAQNTKCKTAKNYHLVITFRPEDENKLTPDIYKKIEKTFSEKLGLEEYQRICAVHQNTGNLHMHLHYNLIHPEKLTKAKLSYDYYKRDQACRECEKVFGLSVDNGHEQATGVKISDKAAVLEAHSGEQTFQRYALDQKKELVERIGKARTWQDVHQVFASLGMEVRPKNGGLVLTPKGGEEGAMKASALDRSFSGQRMEQRFGRYEPSDIEAGEHLSEEDEIKSASQESSEHHHDGQREPASPVNNFQTRILERKERIMTEVRGVKNWQDLHAVLAQHDLSIRPRANGLVLTDAEGNQVMKASALDRSLSRARLEGKLGAFREPAAPDPKNIATGAGHQLDRKALALEIRNAQDWQSVHKILEQRGMGIRPKNNGLVIVNAQGQEMMKASALDRSLSRARLEDGLGLYVPPARAAVSAEAGTRPDETRAGNVHPEEDEWIAQAETLHQERMEKQEREKKRDHERARSKYERKPIHPQSETRDRLYRQFLEQRQERDRRIEEENARNRASRQWLADTWRKDREETYNGFGTRKMKARNVAYSRSLYRQYMEKESRDHREILANIKKEHPWAWGVWLQQQAIDGSVEALAVLRSQAGSRGHPAAEKTGLRVPYNERQQARAAGARWDGARMAWYVPKGGNLDNFQPWLGERERQRIANEPPVQLFSKLALEYRGPGERLLHIIELEQKRIVQGSARESLFKGSRFNVDSQGVVMILLANKGIIRDTGEKIFFSKDKGAKEAAKIYAGVKFGSKIQVRRNVVEKIQDGKWTKWKGRIADIRILRDIARNGLRTVSQLPMVCCRKAQPHAEMLLSDHARRDMGR